VTEPPIQTEGGNGLFGPIRPPKRRATVRILILALLAAALCWYFGANALHAILIGGVVTTVGVIGLVASETPDLIVIDWRSAGRPNRHGARSDVAELSWTLRGSFGRVGSPAVWRARRLARQRLARHQLDLLNPADRPEIERLIGRRAYAVLVSGERRSPLLRTFVHCLDALDALDPARPSTPPSGSRRRRPIVTRPRPRRARER
jgi:hypothetical protein